jgi:hypothetical protein
MTAACTHGVAAESWIDFFVGELDGEAGERLEQLLFECAHCAAEAERWGAVIGGVEIAIPPVLSPEALLALQDRGERMNEELARADSVNLELSTPAGASLVRFEDVPFDGDTGEVIVACQRHFGESFPANIVFAIERRVVDEVEVVARYTIEHADWV